MFLHEESYKGLSISAFIHRYRLKSIFNLFDQIDLKQHGKLADYGCSNGFILSKLQQKVFFSKEWEYYGFDYSQDLLEMAVKQNLRKTRYKNFNLNKVDSKSNTTFDVVTCFETLEHTGNYKNAFMNLYHVCKINGKIIISVPNEKGLPGILKFFGRQVVRRAPYGEFFLNKSRLKYLQHLLLNKPLDVFRVPESTHWGTHLGFDWKEFRHFVREEFVETGKCSLTMEPNAFYKFNYFYIIDKLK